LSGNATGSIQESSVGMTSVRAEVHCWSLKACWLPEVYLQVTLAYLDSYQA
jgi:hypothetical protein